MEHYFDDPWYALSVPYYESTPGNVELGENNESMYYRMLDKHQPLFPNLPLREGLTVGEAIALFEPRRINEAAGPQHRLPFGCGTRCNCGCHILKHTRGGPPLGHKYGGTFLGSQKQRGYEDFKCPTGLSDAFLCDPRNACDVNKVVNDEGIDRGDCRCGCDRYDIFDSVRSDKCGNMEGFKVFQPNAHAGLFEHLTVAKAAKMFQPKHNASIKTYVHAPLTEELGKKLFKPRETMLSNSQASMLKLAFEPHTAGNSYLSNVNAIRGKSYENLSRVSATNLFIPTVRANTKRAREDLTDPRFLPDIAKVNYQLGSNVMDIDRVYGTTAQQARYPAYVDTMKYGATTTGAKNLPFNAPGAVPPAETKPMEYFGQDQFYDNQSR